MRILITGGNGFVGQHLVSKLSKENKITVLCRKKHEATLVDIEKLQNVTVHYNSDIQDLSKIEGHFKNIDVVFNLAALISFKQRDRDKLISINNNGTLNILRACEKHNVKKLIHLSSTAAFGYSTGIINEQTKFDWSKGRKCVYSYSKYLPETKLLSSKCNVIVINPPIILGPGDLKILQLLKPLKYASLPIVPSGTNSAIDVRDLVKALVLLMKSSVSNQQFIVSGGSYSIKEMNGVIASKFGKKPPIFTLPKFIGPLVYNLTYLYEMISANPKIAYENVFFGFKDRRHDDSKIRKLGYKPEYSLEKSVEDTIDYLETLGVL
tara:strand:- start:92 stop:1060 length:969 start_codon:yes stop_codon:yes gene_type:complete